MLIKCNCGCDNLVKSPDKNNRIIRFVPGHNNKNSISMIIARTKPVKCLYCGKEYYRNSINQKRCKECVPDRKTDHLMRTYNLSKIDYDNLLITNNGLCWICLKKKAKFVDHCHKTNKVRGLLCAHCNTGLYMIENKEILERALKYVSIS